MVEQNSDLTAEKFKGLWDRNNPNNKAWMQREDEKDLWYSRFKDFLLQGSSRSVLQAVQKWRREKGKNERNSTPASWIVAKNEFLWWDRAKAFDKAVDEIKEGLWADRQADIVEREWEMAGELYERFKDMLSFPLQTVTQDVVKDQGKTINRTVIRPTKWSQHTMIQLARIVSELGRMAVGMPTEHAQISEGEVKIYIPANTREKGVEIEQEENDNDNGNSSTA